MFSITLHVHIEIKNENMTEVINIIGVGLNCKLYQLRLTKTPRLIIDREIAHDRKDI